ncbi:MAG: (Fe-S)-binding protein, partial [Verrucomicrobia bacterium]|nr:(Fe-S)-binding protein [Verrucomicrobiota bacterium]
CCGQPAYNTGYWQESKPIAEKLIDQLKDAEVIAVASGSCGAMIKVFYPELFAGTTYDQLAKEVASKCYEFSDFLVSKLGVTDVGARFSAKVTFHDGCHSLREMHIKDAPRKLMSRVQGLEVVEMSETVCCGFGGTFSAKFPAISTAMGEVKCGLAAATGADYIVSNDSSCLMHIQGLLDRQGKSMKTIHLAEILAQS